MTDNEADGRGLADRQPEPEGEQRHDEDAAAEPQERSEDAGTDAAGDHQHERRHPTPLRGGSPRRTRRNEPPIRDAAID